MKRLRQLDGVRGVAILLVLAWHYGKCQLPGGPRSTLSHGLQLLNLTWSGVDLFFVLSGFLIAGILLDHRNTANYFRVFYLRRTCRIFPVYFLLLGSFAALAATPIFTAPAFDWLFARPFPLWSYATFTQNILMGARGDFGPHWLGITWSLAVEEQFYLVAPLLIYLLPRRWLVGMLLAGLLSAPALRYFFPGFHAVTNTPWRMDGLLAGALLAVLVRHTPFVAFVRQNGRLLLAGLAALLGGAGLMSVSPESFGIFNHTWLAALYSVVVLMAFMGQPVFLTRVLQLPVLVWFGQLSYGIYMYHEAVSGLLHGTRRGSPPAVHNLAEAGITLTALVITLVLATLSFRFFESPILRFSHRFPYLPPGKDSPRSPSSATPPAADGTAAASLPE